MQRCQGDDKPGKTSKFCSRIENEHMNNYNLLIISQTIKNLPTGVTGYHCLTSLVGQQSMMFVFRLENRYLGLAWLVITAYFANVLNRSHRFPLFLQLCFCTSMAYFSFFSHYCMELIASYRSWWRQCSCLFVRYAQAMFLLFISEYTTFLCNEALMFEYCCPALMKSANIWITIHRHKGIFQYLFVKGELFNWFSLLVLSASCTGGNFTSLPRFNISSLLSSICRLMNF